MFCYVNRVSNLLKGGILAIISLSKLWSVTDSVMHVFLLEVVADDTPAVQAVLKADTRRLKLLEEEKQLQSRLDKGDDTVTERLAKVTMCVHVHHF